ncbi:helix-turn-helix transcriptional regulator [Parvibaculaceae bacterium PLY_AMNH_Bact1]|nr:helix-turn-helix transcriptional regulator [Parvibaculaceae bacterium PLY_AMNH_Bact1]
MKLKSYLEENKIDHAEFADAVGSSVSGVRKWLSGERVPRRDAMNKIIATTGGAVTAADFFPEPAEG